MTETKRTIKQTQLGGMRVRTVRKTGFTVEDLVEVRARGVVQALRLEHRRERLASADESLQGLNYAPRTR